MSTTSNTLSTRTNLKQAIPLAVPLAVYIDIFNKCNFTCSWCPTGNFLKPAVGQGEMNLKLFEKIVSDFACFVQKAGKKIKTLNLFWMGEPLLNKDLCTMIRVAKKACISERIMISTNGSPLTKLNSQKLVESGVDLVSISFYGNSNDDYRLLHKSMDFDKIVKNARSLLSFRNKMEYPTPLVAAKLFERDSTLEDLLVNKLKCVDVVAYESPFNWNSEYNNETGHMVRITSPGPMEVCPSPWFVMSIGWDGHVGVCCADWKYNIDVGNLNENSVIDVWNGEKLVHIRTLIAARRYAEIGACSGCTYFKISHDDATNIDSLIENDLGRALSTCDYRII